MAGVEDYCDICNHKLVFHGDRAIGGICMAGKWPQNPCWCPSTDKTPVKFYLEPR